MKRSEILSLLGFLSLILAIVMPEFELGNDHLFVYAIIFFTGSIITGAIEEKK